MLRSVDAKLTAFIGTAIALGFVLVASFHAGQHERSILRQNERTVEQVAGSVIEGLEAVMLAGHADVAESYAARLKRLAGVADFRVVRASGEEAFLDNATIRRVNEVRGDAQFAPRRDERRVAVLAAADPRLVEVVRTRRFVRYYEDIGGEPALTFLWPVLNGKECGKCHGRDHAVRGVLKFSTSMRSVGDEVARLRLQSGVVMAGALLAMVFVMRSVLRRTVVRPIRTLSEAMGRVAAGDLAQAVPVIGRDELARVATSFGRLIDELRETHAGLRAEHAKLQTIIQGSRDGIVVTDAAGDVVLVNPAAARLLGKTGERIVGEGFDALFDAPADMARWLDRSLTDAETIFHCGRYLSVTLAVARADDGRVMGRTAMIRDLTEQKLAGQKLRAMSNTDGLTGLANRRLLDEVLRSEVQRTRRNGRSFSVLLFDVDHFKRFNDEHGHAQGDRVLKAVAEAALRSIRSVDLACRYGGEEFVVVLTETTAERAQAVAERLRAGIAAARVDGLGVTVSVGVAGFLEGRAADADALLEQADRALYEAKRGGRNRVATAGGGPA